MHGLGSSGVRRADCKAKFVLRANRISDLEARNGNDEGVIGAGGNGGGFEGGEVCGGVDGGVVDECC